MRTLLSSLGHRNLLTLLVAAAIGSITASFDARQARAADTDLGRSVMVTSFLPEDYVNDGSVSYHEELQEAIDAVGKDGAAIFPAGVYRLEAKGLTIKSHMTLMMAGAVFCFDDKASEDGQAFLGENVEDVNFVGGEIVGRNDVWPDGVNIGGIKLLGASKNIRIYDTRMRDLSSVGIGIFGSEDQPASNVQVTNVVTDNCCNKYGDYVSGRPGPEKGSKREDQGGICFYYVNDWLVEGCRFERSRSDGTHFFRSRRGQFVDNKVYGNKMGGYFIEDCADVLASDNVIRDNGSRGATIERGSHNCTLRGNVIAQSGREGLWAPNCVGLIVTGNFFDTNGRKANGDTPTRIWNANITIDNAPSKTPQWPMPSDYIVADNIITTTADQIAAIRVDADVASGIVIHDNLLRGENHKVLVQGEAKGKVKADDNE